MISFITIRDSFTFSILHCSTSQVKVAVMDARKKRLLSLHNQRSQLNFTAHGLYGPKAQLVENLPIREREAVEVDDPSSDHHLFWTEPPETVFVVKKIRDGDVTEKFKVVVKFLAETLKVSVVVEPIVLKEISSSNDETFLKTQTQLQTWTEDTRKQVLETVDFIICVGGDGTILYATSLFQGCVPPVMSFHVGSLGFLTHFVFEKHEQDIRRVLDTHVSLTFRHRLQCVLKTDYEVSIGSSTEECPLSPSPSPGVSFNPGKSKLHVPLPVPVTTEETTVLVVNELVVDRGPHPFLTNLELFCNGRFMTSVQGDGIIISTPTGSTAYSLAAGASMVHPSVPCMVVTPICPHSLSFRPTILPSGVQIAVRVASSSRNSAWVAFDGRNRREIMQGDSVVVTTSPWPVPTVNNTGHVTDWFDSLAECLHWNVRKKQKQLS